MFDIYGTETKILSGYSYLFNGLLDFELKKFVPIVGTRINKIETYEEIFTSYLAEDEAYFEAIGDEEHYELPMIKYLLDDDSERIDTVIEGMGAANDIIKDYSGYDISTEDLKMIKSSAALGKQLDHAIKLYSFAAIYTDHVTDHYEMLDAIYDFEATRRKNKNKIIVVNEESFAGADKIYKMYTDDQKKAIANYIGKQIENKVKDLIEDGIKDGISSELSLGHAFAWSKLAASVMKAYFIATDFYVYDVSRKCENLPYYNKLMERGASKFWAYNNAKDNISKDNIEKARLSAIFTLLSSRSMYQALCDSDKALENSGAIYQKKIDAINEALKKLYLAKNCCLTDSGEYIDERIKTLHSSLDSIDMLNSNAYELNSVYDSSIFAALSMAFQNDDVEDEYMVNDLDNDGNLELAFYTSISKSGRGSCILFENVSSPAIYNYTATGAAGYCGFVYDNESERVLFNNNWASVGSRKFSYSEWNGHEWSEISLFYDGLGDNGTRDISDCHWRNENVSEEQFMQLSDEIQNNWNNSGYIFNNCVDETPAVIADAFYNYLSNYFEINPIVKIEDNGSTKYILSVKNIHQSWSDNIVLLNAWGDEYFNVLKTAVTTCFIVDEYQGKTRIRCQNFNENIEFKNENGGLIAYKNDIPFITTISNENGSANNSLITFNKPLNGIEKKDVGSLSEVILNVSARTRAHDGLVLREGPSTDTKQLDLIPYGTNINIISVCDDFRYGNGNSMVLTEYNGKKGYVHSRYILISNSVDLSNFTIKQKFAFGVLYYNQAQDLQFDFWHNGGTFDCTSTGEYDGVYVKLLPAGITISKLTEEFYKYFSNDYTYGDAEGLKVDFNHSYKEKDGYIWQATGFGGDPSWDYDEVIEMTDNAPDRIRFKVIHHYDPQFYEYYGCETKEYLLSLKLEEGLWKIDAPFTIQ